MPSQAYVSNPKTSHNVAKCRCPNTLSPLQASMPNIVADAELPEKLGTGSSRFTDASNIKKMRWEATSVTAAGRTRA